MKIPADWSFGSKMKVNLMKGSHQNKTMLPSLLFIEKRKFWKKTLVSYFKGYDLNLIKSFLDFNPLPRDAFILVIEHKETEFFFHLF